MTILVTSLVARYEKAEAEVERLARIDAVLKEKNNGRD